MNEIFVQQAVLMRGFCCHNCRENENSCILNTFPSTPFKHLFSVRNEANLLTLLDLLYRLSEFKSFCTEQVFESILYETEIICEKGCTPDFELNLVN